MALPPLASTDDLAVWLGRAVSNEDQAEAVIAAASTLVRTETGRTYVDEDGNLEEDLPDAVRTVVVLVASRVLSNPDSYISETIAGYSYRVADGTVFGLELTDTERRMLGGTESALTSVRVESPPIPTSGSSFWSETELVDLD